MYFTFAHTLLRDGLFNFINQTFNYLNLTTMLKGQVPCDGNYKEQNIQGTDAPYPVFQSFYERLTAINNHLYDLNHRAEEKLNGVLRDMSTKKDSPEHDEPIQSDLVSVFNDVIYSIETELVRLTEINNKLDNLF